MSIDDPSRVDCWHDIERYDAHDSVWRCVHCGHVTIATDADFEDDASF